MARIVIPELAHHVTQRGNGRRAVFFTPQDRYVYLGLLQEYSQHYRLRILGYALMSNHVHLVVVPEHEGSLAKTMREVHGRYARYRNTIERGAGHLWQGRYYSCAFEGVRMANVMRYVELNPVRAQLVRAAEDYAWKWAEWLSQGEEETRAIREATYSGRVLGCEEFVARLEAATKKKLVARRPGRPKKEVRAAVANLSA